MIPRGEILARFRKVYKSGDNEYQCLCPSHDDNFASLGLKFTQDKMILNCFAGCSMESIIGAVGLSWGDVMPDDVDLEYKPSSRIKFQNPYAIIKATKDDLLFVALCSAKMRNGESLEKIDNDKLYEVIGRLRGIYNDIT